MGSQMGVERLLPRAYPRRCRKGRKVSSLICVPENRRRGQAWAMQSYENFFSPSVYLHSCLWLSTDRSENNQNQEPTKIVMYAGQRLNLAATAFLLIHHRFHCLWRQTGKPCCP